MGSCYLRVPLDPCQQCGGPLTATQGQHVIFTAAITHDDHGRIVFADVPQANWCGACIEDWNQRMETP